MTVRLSITGPVKTVMHTSILPAASDVVYIPFPNLICAVDGAHIHRVSMAKVVKQNKNLRKSSFMMIMVVLLRLSRASGG